MFKRIFSLLNRILIGMLCCCMLLGEGVAESAYVRSFTYHDILELARDTFDDIYPGLTTEQKQDLAVSSLYSTREYDATGEWQEIWELGLAYNKENSLCVYMTFTLEGGELIDYTPWNLSAAADLMDAGITREEAIAIASPVYEEALQMALEAMPERAQLFQNAFGEDSLDPAMMLTDTDWTSKYNGGGKDYTTPSWSVYFFHPADLIVPCNYGNNIWFAVKIDALTGKIIETSPDDYFFTNQSYIFRIDP